MRKLLYIPAALFFLFAAGSAFVAGHDLFVVHDNGSAALHIIFVFTGLMTTIICLANTD